MSSSIHCIYSTKSTSLIWYWLVKWRIPINKKWKSLNIFSILVEIASHRLRNLGKAISSVSHSSIITS